MQTIRMKLADMHKPEKNVRMHTENQLVEYERSVRMFGQTRPIIVDEDGLILVGNGLFDTLSRMGEEDADVYVMNGLSQSEKKKLMIADNKIFNLGVENLTVLNEFIEDLKDDLDIPGFDEDIHVAEALPVQERKALIGKATADVLDVLHFAVVGFLVLHIRWFWFPDTKVGTKNETYVRQTSAENLFIKAGAKSRPEGYSSGGHSGSRP